MLAREDSSSAEEQSCHQGAARLLDFAGTSATFRDAARLKGCLCTQLIHILAGKKPLLQIC